MSILKEMRIRKGIEALNPSCNIIREKAYTVSTPL